MASLELLAPAGNLEKLKIAFLYGADAVYLAGQAFGLRSAADNFNLAQLRQGVEYANQRHKKVYLTLNGVLHNHELAALTEYLQELKGIGPHGLIVSDLGVMRTIRKVLDTPLHVSTQASVLNSYSARAFQVEGASRVVVGRELSLAEAGQLKRLTGLEVEVFGHGALCMSYSGHCTISNYTAGRDSNRGGCIQSCRFRYQIKDQQGQERESYFMSSKDLNGVRLLPEFLRQGIDSLKIEGRMKSQLYIASTVKAYRAALDELQRGDSRNLGFWEQELTKIPHRDYTEANLEHPAGPESTYDQRDHASAYEMAGEILAVDAAKGRMLFQAKNKLVAGESLEFLPFEGSAQTFVLGEMESLTQEPLPLLQPHQVAWLPWQVGLEASVVARFRRSR